MSTKNEVPPNAIAVVGMAGRFPGARTLTGFWDNLRNGVESIVTLGEDELRAAGVSDKALANHNYVRRAALLDGLEEFDAGFFGFTPLAARTMDPQHRLFLQTAWHALEDAGYRPGEIDGAVGVYGTSTTSGYLLHNLMSHYDPNLIIGQGVSFEMVNLSLQNDKDYLATRVAHQLNLRGPALSVQTACSSALVAVHLACQSILNGECDMALAGGSSLRVPHHVGYWHEPGSMVSATGHCRPFDVRADGTIFASGVGVVVLKSLDAAVEDGDQIHAVIRGSALNNDGAVKMTYAAPTAAGQADVIAEAHAVSEVDASTITYIESHGTGTPLGDPIEIEGLRQAFAVSEEPRSGPCYVGSVKSNIGHLESASGIASLIKTILCLKHRALPATLHYTSPNPELHLEDGPFRIRGEYGPWESDGIRRAGVSSFGVGGTNAHVIVEEWPEEAAVGAGVAPKPGPEVLLLSARTAEALAQGRAELAEVLAGGDEPGAPALPDVAYSLARRHPESLRLAAVVSDRADAVTVLGAEESDNVFIGEEVAGLDAAADADRVVFLFPGQGAQHIGMARGLYDTEPVFAEYFDRCVAGFDAELGFDLRAMIFDGTSRDLERTDRTQPALFTVEYALAKLVESYGVRPAALVGHSIGEYAAATIAGVFDLDTAIKVVAMRARLMHAAPRGVMVAVPLSPDAVGQYLTGDVDLAAVNDPDGCVVAGSDADIREFTDRLKQAGITARRVRTSHAFHSRLMDSMIPEFTGFLSRQTLREPTIPLLSNLTGTAMAPSEATNPATWARSVRATVRFADEIDTVLDQPHRVLVEVGPGATLTASASRHPKFSGGHRAVRLMRHHAQNRDDRDAFLLALGQLWAAGIEVDWRPLRGDYQPKRVSVPGYPFERQRHWLEHNAEAAWVSGAGARTGADADGASGAAAVAKGETMDTTLARIWAVCLGVGSVDRNANFFDIGGDSLVAISVAMAASHEGLDITPQDLYDNPTVTALAKALTARYAAGGLARQAPGDVVHPPVPPNLTYFLENGLREHGRWRIPLILRLRPDVGVDDVRAVLTAVVNHHDALRLRLTERAGTWEQQVAEPGEFGEIATHSLPEGLTAEHDAVRTLLAEHIRDQDLSSPPLTALYVRGSSGDLCYLALSLHAAVGDEASRDVLVTDIFTAFAQQLEGNEIALQPVGVGWAEWSQRCAGLATHSAVLESREFWLDATTSATLRLASKVAESPSAGDLSKLTATLSGADVSEIDDARRRLGLPIDEILLAGLSRAVADSVGAGTVAVDLGGAGRSVLKPDIDLRRTVGWFTTLYPVALACTTAEQTGARQVLDSVHELLEAVPHYGIGYGLLRYQYAPTARLLGAVAPADIHFSYVGAIPEMPSLGDSPVQFDPDTAMPVRDAIPGLGHALELRAYRTGGALHLDWWYDNRRIEQSVVQAIADAFSDAVLDLVRQAVADLESEADDSDDSAMTLVELS
ncbi:beta-ketoacyl synthase N-terminal-like domain-containing protein [[Mycobacterium] kokjensenii]|uniref:Beta-ketoacyl synthase N-terminal-like domain-containing protein n=1 Tax=[Mycobacterium] kokjensenii TaxID=3064287 RepID=A0ABN9N1Q9_9MYCO|nr:type I polyketide synthase [Mycolicibacter sp. MU0083]CAJ1498956.1 beta-ketoacyl synthase N-terminal-like domain-containing protein [Mycolicibacter sp. MU0083]